MGTCMLYDLQDKNVFSLRLQGLDVACSVKPHHRVSFLTTDHRRFVLVEIMDRRDGQTDGQTVSSRPISQL